MRRQSVIFEAYVTRSATILPDSQSKAEQRMRLDNRMKNELKGISVTRFGNKEKSGHFLSMFFLCTFFLMVKCDKWTQADDVAYSFIVMFGAPEYKWCCTQNRKKSCRRTLCEAVRWLRQKVTAVLPTFTYCLLVCFCVCYLYAHKKTPSDTTEPLRTLALFWGTNILVGNLWGYISPISMSMNAFILEASCRSSLFVLSFFTILNGI